MYHGKTVIRDAALCASGLRRGAKDWETYAPGSGFRFDAAENANGHTVHHVCGAFFILWRTALGRSGWRVNVGWGSPGGERREV